MIEKEKLEVLRGCAIPLGATIQEDGVNFSLYSPYITELYLHLFINADNEQPYLSFKLEIPYNKTGDIWHIKIAGLKEGSLYLFSAKGVGIYESYILEPYFKQLTPHSIFLCEQLKAEHLNDAHSKNKKELTAKGFPKCVVIKDDSFDWQGDKRPAIPLSECIIYESHVRGASIKACIPQDERGTYLGMIHLIPYFKKLGITTLELMPVFEFDENEIERISEDGVNRLKNYWGYSPLSFFAPKAKYAKNARNAVNEFKEMVRSLHKANIEVVLDVVFNHTAEGGEGGHRFSFKVLAENEYYLLDEKGFHQNYSGCGNTFNTASEVCQKIILDSLCYWAGVMHVDGFRFDLASIFMREGTSINPYSALIKKINECSLLNGLKLIAEPWDACSSYNLGQFPPEWFEWNDKYRDTFRRFWLRKTNLPQACNVLDAFLGSPNIFRKNADGRNTHSINFITCHDGFTMLDLVSYNQKHNESNMEENRDGSDSNFSFNHGVEGKTLDEKIVALRHRQIKNLLFSLFLSSGTPMLLMGDEVMRTQNGCNNAYCQDNEASYFDWSMLEKNEWLCEYVAKLNMLRRRLNLSLLFAGKGADAIVCFDEIGQKIEMNRECAFLSIFVQSAQSGAKNYFIILNRLERDVTVILPKMRNGGKWACLLDTYYTSLLDEDFLRFGEGGDEQYFPGAVYISISHSASIFASN